MQAGPSGEGQGGDAATDGRTTSDPHTEQRKHRYETYASILRDWKIEKEVLTWDDDVFLSQRRELWNITCAEHLYTAMALGSNESPDRISTNLVLLGAEEATRKLSQTVAIEVQKKRKTGARSAARRARPMERPNEHIGRQVKTRTPGGRWERGTITNYNPKLDQHEITYDLGTTWARSEWFTLALMGPEVLQWWGPPDPSFQSRGVRKQGL